MGINMKRFSATILSICVFGIFLFSVFASSVINSLNNVTSPNNANEIIQNNPLNSTEEIKQNITSDNLEQTNSEWHKTYDRHDLYASAFGNGVYVAVGADGIIKISNDGQTWTVASSHSVLLQGVVWGNDKFVTVGSLGKIYVSGDGKTWSESTSGTDKNLIGVAWNGSMFVVVGDKGTILTSNDGLSWTKRPLQIDYSISNIVSGKGKFIATISDTFNIILQSDDGVSWNTIEPFGKNYGYFNACFNGNTFFMNGKIPNQEGHVTVTSDNGVDWSETTNSPKIRSITADGKSFIAIGDSKMDENSVLTQSVYTSNDGTDWTTNEVKWDSNYFSDLRFIYWCNDKYIGLKYSGDIYISGDALQWSREKSSLDNTYEHFIWNGSQLIAYSANGNLLVSDDGNTWTASTVTLPIEKPFLNVFFFGSKSIVIAGSPAKMFTSNDGANWNIQDISGLENSRILSSQDKLLLIAGNAMYLSSDANTWEQLLTPSQALMTNSIAYNGQTYVSVGGQPIIQGGEGNRTEPYRITGSSSNMKDWTVNRTENTPSLNSVIWTNGKFVAVGESGVILNSTDGLSWTQVISGTSQTLLSIIWDGNRYIACGNAGTILLSKDGITWSNYKSDITNDVIAKIEQIGTKYIGIGTRSILSGAITVQFTTPEEKTFADIQNHWAKDDINQMASRKLVNGVDENNYAPDREITRSEFSAIIVRALDLKSQGSKSEFTDVTTGDWYYESIYAAFDNGIIKGYGDGLVEPNKAITREEAMAMITRAMKFKGLNTDIAASEVTVALSMFMDRANVSSWAKEAATICIKNNIIQGSDGLIKPINNISRAETATIILRLLKKAE